MVTRRQWLGAVTLLAASGWAPSSAQVTGGYGIPRVSLPDFPDGDVLAGSRPGATWSQLLTMSSLLNMTPEGRVTGGLALAWTLSANRMQLDLVIRIDALFSNGTRILPRDVFASVIDARERHSNSLEMWRWERCESVELTPEGVIRFALNEPDASFFTLLTSRWIPVVPAAWISQGWDRQTGPFPPASGCFKLETRSEDRLRFSRNDGYYQVGRPRLAGIICNAPVGIIPRTTDLVTNGVDLLIDVPLLDVPLLREDPGILVVGGPSNQLCLLAVNLRSATAADPRLRRLLSRAIDREELVRAATAGEATAASTLIHGDHWAGLDARIDLTDPADVRDQLDALGNPPGIELRLVASEVDASLANAGVLLQEQLAWAGIALSLDFLNEAEMDEEMAGADWDLTMRYTPYWDDPHELVRPLLVSDAPGNVGSFRNQRLDDLVGLANRARDNENRGRLYRIIQEIVLDQAPVIPLFFPNYYDAMRTRLQDYPFHSPISAAAMSQATMSRPEPVERP